MATIRAIRAHRRVPPCIKIGAIVPQACEVCVLWFRSCLLFPMLMAATSACAAETCAATSGAQVVPLIELYTAEGCNECPPADRWLSQLAMRADSAKTAALAFHVDYWDAIGWPDRFADAKYDQRQELRITLAHKRVTVTPQVMVGKDVMVNWRSQAQVDSLLEKTRARRSPVQLAMQVVGEPGALSVTAQASKIQGPTDDIDQGRLWLALYQDGLTSAITAGENKGRTLHHDRVVRALAGPWALDEKPVSGSVRIPLPVGAGLQRMGLVLFAESGKTGEALQALSLPLAPCLR